MEHDDRYEQVAIEERAKGGIRNMSNVIDRYIKDRQFICLYRRSRKIQLSNCKSVEALGFPLRSVRNGRLQFFCYIGVVLYFR